MKNALLTYSHKAMARPGFFNPCEYEGVPDEMTALFKHHFLIPRTTKTNLAPFREKFGFDLPDDIADYINLYWHSYICGAYDCMKQSENGSYYPFDEGPILFSVLKHTGETDDDVLFQKYGVCALTEEFYQDWEEHAEENPSEAHLLQEAKQFICIGWTGYAAHSILYQRATGEIYLESWRPDKVADDKPIAASLSALISGIYFR